MVSTYFINMGDGYVCFWLISIIVSKALNKLEINFDFMHFFSFKMNYFVQSRPELPQTYFRPIYADLFQQIYQWCYEWIPADEISTSVWYRTNKIKRKDFNNYTSRSSRPDVFLGKYQIYRRIPMPKCDFKSNVHIFRTPFPKKTTGRLLLY